MEAIDDQVVHKELVARIYSIHEKLRRERRNNNDQDWELIWQQHVKDPLVLQEYAASMSKLATKIWEPKTVLDHNDHDHPKQLLCRLEWVNAKCREYFQDELKTEKKLKLLDVGSCYNPFQKFSSFYDITAIDLCPAPGLEKVVYKCDFLTLQVSREFKVGSEGRLLVSLPQNYFDVVVFSFFLEYLPDRTQRLKSCKKAHDLLRQGGILFILRPDSGTVTPTGHSQLMKALKVGNGLLGFKRVYFEKLLHLWCTGFVKLSEEEASQYLESLRFQKDVKKVKESYDFSVDDFSILFSIAQDFREYDNDAGSSANKNQKLSRAPVDVESFLELPEYCGDE